VIRAPHVAEAIDLQQVAAPLVDEHAAQHERVIVRHLPDLFGVATVLDHPLNREVAREMLEPAQVDLDALAARVKPDPEKKGPQRPRCPSCFGEVPKGQRERTCLYCGFSFDVVPPLKPRRASR
jgi:hypothetical protein